MNASRPGRHRCLLLSAESLLIYLFSSSHDHMHMIRYVRSHPGPYLYSYLGVVFCFIIFYFLMVLILSFCLCSIYTFQVLSAGVGFSIFSHWFSVRPTDTLTFSLYVFCWSLPSFVTLICGFSMLATDNIGCAHWVY
jgi:hypothetical protein